MEAVSCRCGRLAITFAVAVLVAGVPNPASANRAVTVFPVWKFGKAARSAWWVWWSPGCVSR
jgi:hypothetical protein